MLNKPVCAGIVVKNDQNCYLLVLGKKAGKWGFPKGHIENEESWVECAERETLEETGLRLRIEDESKRCFTRKSVYFLVRTDLRKGECTLQTQDANEVEKIEWFSEEELRNFNRGDVNYDLWEFIKALRWMF